MTFISGDVCVSRPMVYNLQKKNEFRWIQLDGGKYRISQKSFDDRLDKLSGIGWYTKIILRRKRKIKRGMRKWKLLLSQCRDGSTSYVTGEDDEIMKNSEKIV